MESVVVNDMLFLVIALEMWKHACKSTCCQQKLQKTAAAFFDQSQTTHCAV